jgi:hypothetical protein
MWRLIVETSLVNIWRSIQISFLEKQKARLRLQPGWMNTNGKNQEWRATGASHLYPSPIVQEQEGLFVPSCLSFASGPALLATASGEDAVLRENTSPQ